MTGYGKSTCEINGKKILVEIRALNSKQLDFSSRMPPAYREKEIEVRNRIGRELHRGKIDVSIQSEVPDKDRKHQINAAVAGDYIRQLRELGKTNGLDPGDQLLAALLKLPDMLMTEPDVLDEQEWKAVSACIGSALDELADFRLQEGKSLEADIRHRLELILGYLDRTIGFEGNRIENIRTRIEKNLAELVPAIPDDRERLEREMIYFLEKLDITEEKIRLKNHCRFFTETLGSEEPVGKKLGFISQEMGREINTLGSKANDPDIKKLVVEMKDELEKIREQLQNVL